MIKRYTNRRILTLYGTTKSVLSVTLFSLTNVHDKDQSRHEIASEDV